MHGAPSVTFPVGRSRLAGAILLALWAGGAASVAAWGLHGAPVLRLVFAGAACLACAAWAAAWWFRAVAGRLDWDGAAWWLGRGAGPAEHGTVEVALDLQRLLLVRWRGETGAHWLWAERASDPSRWAALRRAVYSPAAAGGPSGAEPPPAAP